MVSIIRFAGSNCEFDMHYVYQDILGIPSAIVWHKESALPSETKLVVLPGGFSYGDYLRSGAIARFAPIMRAIKAFGEKGGRILGICNGFQILTEAKLLPGALMRNANLHFISKIVPLCLERTDNVFLHPYAQGDSIALPIAHADGNYYIKPDEQAELEENGQILMRYVYDINGSVGRIAGICNKDKNIFGLMPHPERLCDNITKKRLMYANILNTYKSPIGNAESIGQHVSSPQGLAMLESLYKA